MMEKHKNQNEYKIIRLNFKEPNTSIINGVIYQDKDFINGKRKTARINNKLINFYPYKIFKQIPDIHFFPVKDYYLNKKVVEPLYKTTKTENIENIENEDDIIYNVIDSMINIINNNILINAVIKNYNPDNLNKIIIVV